MTTAGLMVLLAPTLASAEVMDKEPTIAGLWSLAAVFGFLALVAWERNPRWGAFITFVALCFVASTHLELNDPVVNAAILREAGEGYFSQAYLCMSASLALQFLAIANYLRRRGVRPSLGRVA